MRVPAALPILLAFAPLPGQAPPPYKGETPMLLAPGARWTWSVEGYRGLKNLPATRAEAICEGCCTLADGRRVHQLRIEVAGDAPRFEYWAVDADGIWQYPCAVAGRRGAIAADRAPLRWLELPAVANSGWRWSGPHDRVRDEQGRDFAHRATVVAMDERVAVPAGTFTATHVHVDSSLDGDTKTTRDLWFAPGIGLVKEHHRDALGESERALAAYSPATDDRAARVHRQLEADLAKPGTPAWNNPPWLAWIEGGPETLLLPGQIAVAKGELGTACYYVDALGVTRFDANSGNTLAAATTSAFGSKSALVPDDLPLQPLALLLARVEAERRNLARLEVVPITLTPPRPLPRGSHRHASVEVVGGASDGTQRRVAVWLTIQRQTDVQVASDWELPKPSAKAR